MSVFSEVARALAPESGLGTQLSLGSLVATRVLPIVFQAPFLGGQLIRSETRLGLALLLTGVVFPFATGGAGEVRFGGATHLVLLIKELYLGFLIGFAASSLFYAMESSGRALDLVRGAGQAEVQVPHLHHRSSPLGHLNFQLALVTFCALDGHHHFIENVVESFRLVPVQTMPTFGGDFRHLTEAVLIYMSGLFKIALALIFPGLFAAFFTDVVFGMLNRIAPQLNAYFMAMGIKALGGLFLFLVALDLMMGRLADHIARADVFVTRLVRLLG